MKFLKQHPIFIAAVAIALVVTLLAIDSLLARQQNDARAHDTQPTLVTVAIASNAELIDQVESVGTALANESVTITAKVTDTVSKIHFEDGMLVDAGDILVELTNSEETAQLAEASATVEETTRQFNRVKNLIAQKLASETQLDTEKARMKTATARLNAIIARLDDRLIRAPFSGLLGFRNISQGTMLSPTTTVTTLDDISTIKVDFSMAERYLQAITADMDIMASSAAYPGFVFHGKVETINSRIDPITRSVTVRARLDNEEHRLRPGMLLSVILVTDRVITLILPEEAIIPIQNRNYVYRVIELDIAERIEVVIGRRVKGRVEIISGLSVGDRVVTQGIIKLSPGSNVRTAQQSDEQSTTPKI